MGLDIYHKKVCSEKEAESTYTLANTEDGSPHPLSKFAEWAYAKEHQYVDWNATFARKNLTPQDYHCVMQSNGEGCVEFTFQRRDEAPANVPEKVSFTHPHDKPNESDLVLYTKDDQVLGAIEVGYQRKSVFGAFYDEFEGWEFVTDKSRVERIYALTHPDYQPAFKQNFLDNWEEGRSFVIVWY